MTTKPTGLAAFTRKGGRQSEQMAEAVSERKKKAPRGKGETVSLTVRLPRADWMRLHHLAMSEGGSLQALAIQGFNKVLAEHGLPSISRDGETS
jgi:hypothetical protein